MPHHHAFHTILPYHIIMTSFAAGPANTLYTGCDHYDVSNFFSEFSFFTGTDPTGGFVSYQQSIFLGVDYKTVNPPEPSRASVRVTSNKAYTQGIFLADIAHMPGFICGVWPAFWTFGPDWPASGEIDIIEGVSENDNDTITLHTTEGCKMTNTGALPGSNLTNPDFGAGGGNDGCTTTTTSTQGYGDGFNDIGRGIYTMQWTSYFIKV